MGSVSAKIGELYNYVDAPSRPCIPWNSLGIRDKCYDIEMI